MNSLRRAQLREDLREQRDRLTALVARHGTPLLVLQPHLVARRYRQLADALPGFRLHYAVKALPHPLVLSTIAVCGGAFDVATSAEIDQLRGLSVPMDRCIDTHPVKKPADIDHAYAAGIRTFVVENPCEAAKSSADRMTSRCWCDWRSAIRPPSRTCRRSSVSSPPRPNCWSNTCSRRE